MANIEGQYNVSNYEANRIVVDLRDEIFLLNPSATPFLTFGQKLTGDPADNMQFMWTEDDFVEFTDTAKSAAAADATTVYVTAPTQYAINMIVWNQTTDERMLVTSVVSASDYILVTRAFGETTSATVLAADPLVILGSAALEGDSVKAGLFTTKTSVFNYCEEFRTAWNMTERTIATKTRTGNSWPYEKMKKAEEHKMEQERMLLFGERKVAYTSGAARYATRGLKTFIASANKYNVGGIMAEADFDDWVRSVFRAGSGGSSSQTKILLANDRLLTSISRYSKAKVQTSVSDTKYGMNITDYFVNNNKVKLVYHKLLDKTHSTTGYGMLYDPLNVKLRYFKGDQFDGHTKLHENIQANDVTARTDEFRTTVGLEVMHASTHGEVSNVLG